MFMKTHIVKKVVNSSATYKISYSTRKLIKFIPKYTTYYGTTENDSSRKRIYFKTRKIMKEIEAFKTKLKKLDEFNNVE